MTAQQQRSFTYRWWPFVLLCVLASTRWMLTEAWPQSASTLASEAVGCDAGAVLAFAYALLSKAPRPALGQFAGASGAGALLLCGPLLTLFVPRAGVAGTDRTVALALVLVVVAVVSSAGRQNAGISAVPLWAGMAAVAGLLLLLPEPQLGDAGADIVLLLMPLLTGAGCVFLADSKAATNWCAASALCGAGAVLGLGAGGLAVARHSGPAVLSPLAACIDSVVAVLTVVAVQRISPEQFATVFALTPLAVLLQGLVLLRPGLSPRTAVGLLLLGLGGVWPLRRSGRQPSGRELPSLFP